MEESMSLDVALDIIGTLRMMKINAIAEEKDTNHKAVLSKELEVLTVEENITSGLMQFEGWETVRMSVMDKIKRLYAPMLKTYYTTTEIVPIMDNNIKIKVGDKVLISTELTNQRDWIRGTVIEVENNPFVGIVISAETEIGNIFFGQEYLFNLQITAKQNGGGTKTQLL